MSRDAEAAVQTFMAAHAGLKRSARAVLQELAKLIPDGETMTPAIGDEDFAARIGYRANAVRRGRKILVRMAAVHVEGGQGLVSRYELLLLAGARGAPPVLPLIGAVPPRRPRPDPARGEPDLFESIQSMPVPPVAGRAPDAARANDIDQNDRSWRVVLRSFWAKWRSYFDHFDRSTEDEAKRFDHFDRSTTSDLVSARGTYTLKEEHTHASAGAGPTTTDAKPPPCRNPAHAWCAGRVHVPRELHHEFLRKGGHREAELVAFYARRCATLPPEQPILENDFRFWRRCYGEEFGAVSRPPPRAEGAIGRTCAHEPMCSTITACIERAIADARGERKAGSG